MAPATETRTIRAYIHDTQGIFAAPAGITGQSYYRSKCDAEICLEVYR
jgi:hypothetical protein